MRYVNQNYHSFRNLFREYYLEILFPIKKMSQDSVHACFSGHTQAEKNQTFNVIRWQNPLKYLRRVTRKGMGYGWVGFIIVLLF